MLKGKRMSREKITDCSRYYAREIKKGLSSKRDIEVKEPELTVREAVAGFIMVEIPKWIAFVVGIVTVCYIYAEIFIR